MITKFTSIHSWFNVPRKNIHEIHRRIDLLWLLKANLNKTEYRVGKNLLCNCDVIKGHKRLKQKIVKISREALRSGL